MPMKKLNVRFDEKVALRCEGIAKINRLDKDVISNASMVARAAMNYGLDMLEEMTEEDRKSHEAGDAESQLDLLKG